MLVALLTPVTVALVPTSDASPDFPSWGEVQAARSDAAASQAEYRKVSAALSDLQNRVDAAAAEQLKAQASYTVAADALEQAATTARTTAHAAAVAHAQAVAAGQRYGAFAAQLYRFGSGDLSAQLLTATGSDAGTLLDRLGFMTQITVISSRLDQSATVAANLAQALTAQATSAEQARAAAARTAQARLNDAEQATIAAQSALAVQRQHVDELYAQAAALQNTAVTAQKQYYAGVAYREELARRKAAAEAAARAAASGGSSNAASGGGSQLALVAVGLSPDPAAAQSYASGRMGAYGWNGAQFQCLVTLWSIESGWRVNAYNTSSGAYGIPQALPAGKLAAAGADWMTNARTQVDWGLGYIASRYGSPCNALQFETSHSPYWY